MSQFKFRLRSIQALRERERDAAADSYRQARLAISKLEEEVARVLNEHAAQNPTLETIQGNINTQRLLEVQRYQMHLMQQVEQLRSQIQMVEVEAEKRRLLLVKREQAVHAMQNLQDRQQLEWETANQVRAQIALDEWSGFRYWKEQAE
jgi:flagellar export protein FliJ